MTTDPGAVASSAATWDDLATSVRSCVACPELVVSRTTVVAGARPGDLSRADVMLVGEAPGAQEDLAGEPFVGRSGQLLDSLLAEAGLDRSLMAVANVLKCRPPRNRKPRRAEVERCRPWLVRQIELADPRFIVTLGGTAAEWFFGPGARIVDLRQRVHDHDGRPIVVTYHPSAAIRFGPKGAPLSALREDLATVANLVNG